MERFSYRLAAVALAFSSLTQAFATNNARRPMQHVTLGTNGLSADAAFQNAQTSSKRQGLSDMTTFVQRIDHTQPELGTFEQRYVYNDFYWKGSGSPIVFSTPGEAGIDVA
jgi:hypothetical protein